MIRWLIRAFKVLASLVLVAIAAGLVLRYGFGMHVVLDGGGRPHLRFPASADEQASAIEAHRAAQRAAAAEASRSSASTPAPLTTQAPATTPTTGAAGATNPGASSANAAGDSGWPEDWTGFRGPARDGVYRARPVLAAWPAGGLTPIWKEPVGGGYASFAVARGRAFTIEQRGAREVAAAYDVRTGRELWTSVWDAYFQEYMGGDGPRATPAWADGTVFVLGAMGEFRALDEASGKTLWRTNILEDAGAENLQWGMAASPLVVDDTVVVFPGGGSGRSVVAYDRRTGARAWSALDDRAGYAAPMLATLGGERQIVLFSATRLMGVSPDGGQLLWDYPWRTQADINAAQPLVIGGNRLFVSSGYGVGAAVIEISRNASGVLGVKEIWRNTRMKNRFNGSVLRDGFIYGFDESIFACIDAATGDLKWKGGRYGYGQVLLAGERLIVLTEEGDLVLLNATPQKHDELARVQAVSGKTWNVPALSAGILLVRNLAEMAAFDLSVR